MNEDRFNYIVPGIYTPANGVTTANSDIPSWDFQAQRWLYKNGYGLSAGFNYFADVFGGPVWRTEMAAKIAPHLLRAKKLGMTKIVVAGHSNGCAIIVEAFRQFPELVAAELHLIAGAFPKDCAENGLNLIAARHQVGRIFLYVSADDEALGIGSLLGYGTIGRDGPERDSPDLDATTTIVKPVLTPCLHNDWVGRDFLPTVQRIATLGELAAAA